MRRFIDPIPTEYQPKESDNYVSLNVIRAVKSKEMTVENFLPTFVEKQSAGKSFVSQTASYYSLSVFRTLEECEISLNRYPPLFSKFIGFAVGNTNIERGIALKPDKNGHINYFLYDYSVNNPCFDFEYFKDK